MAHTKSQGAVRGNRDSVSKRLGVKVFGGQSVVAGNVILRQKGTKMHPGVNTSMGRDFTIYATASGIVNFKTRRGNKMINVESPAQTK
jgi:large subunit ribosomal protein L27